LVEQRKRLGGSLTLASTVHSDNERFLKFLIQRMRALPIDIRLDTRADIALLKSLAADEVVVASGAKLQMPDIEGIHLSHVITGAHLRQLVNGQLDADVPAFPAWMKLGIRHGGKFIDQYTTPQLLRTVSDWWLPIGKRVVVVGADLAAIELAEFLAKRGRDVAVLEAYEIISPEIGPKRRLEHEKRLEKLKVSINTHVDFKRITPTGVEIGLLNGNTHLVKADTVIVTGEPVADTALFDSIKAAGFSAHAVGDCTGLGLIVKAVYDAAKTANAI
jgi:2,4-dienoyl-CoA reductase (NADPH2)